MRIQAVLVALTGAMLASSALAADVTSSKVPARAAAPSLAPSPLSGDVSISGGVTNVEGFESLGLFAGGGRFAWGLGNSLVLQGDLGGQTLFTSDGFGITDFGLTGHLYNRTMGGAFGLKAGGVNMFGGLIGVMAGAEAQLFLGDVTLGGEVNDIWFSNGGESLLQVRGLGRFYLGPNTRLQGDVAAWSFNNGGLTDVWSVGGSITHRLPNSPVGLNGGVRYDTIEGTHAVTGTVGLTLNFDGAIATQKSHDQTVVFDQYSYQDYIDFMVSDIRLKTDIELVDRLPNGLGLYSYRYLWSDTLYVGVMAQEVQQMIPDAVMIGADGYFRVNYSRLGTRLKTYDEWVEANSGAVPQASITVRASMPVAASEARQ